MMSRRLVAPTRNTPVAARSPSSSRRNWDTMRSSHGAAEPADLRRRRASISSMKMMDGRVSLARLNSLATRSSDSPTHLERRSAADIS